MNRLSLGVILFAVVCGSVACAGDGQPAAIAAPTVAATATAVAIEPTIAPTETAVPPTETSAELDAFIAQLETAVTGQDYATMQSLMSDPIGAGPWRSQWQTLTPAQMVEQFRNNSLPAPLSVQFSGRTLEETKVNIREAIQGHLD